MNLGTIPISVLYLLLALLALALAILVAVALLVRRAKRIEAQETELMEELRNDITGE